MRKMVGTYGEKEIQEKDSFRNTNPERRIFGGYGKGTGKYDSAETWLERSRQREEAFSDLYPESGKSESEVSEKAGGTAKVQEGGISEFAGICAAEKEFFTVEEAAKHLNVSTKTIARWRKQGLESETRLISSRNRVVIRPEALRRFAEIQPKRVEKGRKFSQMSPYEKSEIIERAARMAAAGRKLTEVIRLLAERMGRSAETIRYTLKNHDARHPQDAIFPRYQRTLDEREKRNLLEDFRRGMKMDELSSRYERTKTSIYRILSETRAKLVLEMDLEFISCPEIECAEEGSDEECLILGEMPMSKTPPRKPRLPGNLPSYLASLYSVPLLSFEQEQHLFRKMNYLKRRAFLRREKLNLQHASGKLMEQIENDFSASNEVKNQLVSANLRLVVSIAKRHSGMTNNLFDLISDGNMSLIRAVEKFDYSRKNRFSTYASWAIMKNYTRAISDEQRYHKKFVPLENEANVEREEEEYDQAEFERTQNRQQRRVAEVLKCLTPREQQIIIRRFGLDRNYAPMTLKQVGQELGVTKERIRQLEILALNKLRQMNPVMPEVETEPLGSS